MEKQRKHDKRERDRKRRCREAEKKRKKQRLEEEAEEDEDDDNDDDDDQDYDDSTYTPGGDDSEKDPSYRPVKKNVRQLVMRINLLTMYFFFSPQLIQDLS